jgi:N-methylhydantoinase A
VTDANLVLGRLNPDYFLGGEIKLQPHLAEQAILKRCAEPLGLPLVDAAYGILEIANAAMVSALRLISVQRGYDPRDFAMVAFGGAGPVHAGRLALELDIPTMVIPLSPGIFSAMGLLVTDLRHDFARTMLMKTESVDPGRLENAYADLEGAGRDVLAGEGILARDMSFDRSVEMRYVGQSYELTLAVPSEAMTPATIQSVVGDFHRQHERTYGFSVPGEPTEVVNIRLAAVGRITRPKLRSASPSGAAADTAEKARRPVYFAEAQGYVDCPIYDRYALAEGATIPGPAIVEEVDSTTVVHPGYRVTVDRFGNLLSTR